LAARKRRHLTRQRDAVRLIGWCCVALAPLVLAAPLVDVQLANDVLLRLCEKGWSWVCLKLDPIRSTPWLVASGLLGFGILLLAIRRPVRWEERVECPFCAEPVRFEAIVCPHCRNEFDRTRDQPSRSR